MSADDRAPAWVVDATQALRLERSSRAGLDDGEVERRRQAHGPNRLPRKRGRSPWLLALGQLGGFLNLVLIAAAVLAGLIGDWSDGLLIVAVVVFNAVLGFAQEYRAERTLAALEAMVALRARVLRGGRELSVVADELVPGDVVKLEGGDRVPADGRLIEAHALEIDESALTGESVPVVKNAEPLMGSQTPIAERTNCAFMNTVVTRGRGLVLITATGGATQMGQLARMLDETARPRTPLQVQLDQLGKRLAAIAVVVLAVVSALELFRGAPWNEIVFEAIALFVAAIPEGLPAVVTVTLALGLHRMARQRAIVKRLAAVETLGCTSVICTDKTGTLTLNQMTARAVWLAGARVSVSGEGYRPEGRLEPEPGKALPHGLVPFARALALCNDSRLREGRLLGDPTEGALLVLAHKAGVEPDAVREQLPRLAEVPFESERKFMATLHRDAGRLSMFVKGAPDVLLDRCEALLGPDGDRPLDDLLRQSVREELEVMASQGLRVIAVASRSVSASSLEGRDPLELARDLTLLGLVGLMDPPRPEAARAIALCRRAGITVKMITGDHRATAGAVARELGLVGEVVDGAELDRIDDAGLARRIEGIAVFARVAPEHKLRIVKALKVDGHVVAMTGDGVNDAPALKSADIGVAMGSGTEVAKEAATMVLTDDNFATVVGAVREGRTIYDNIVKFVRFQLSTNLGAILTVFCAPLLGLHTPLRPIHILFVAMFADGPPAIALGFDPARRAVMDEPPRAPQARILSLRRLALLFFHGGVIAAGTLGVMQLAGVGADHAATVAFTTFVLFQLFNLINIRAGRHSTLGRHTFTNYRLWLAVALVAGLQVALVSWAPLRALFDTVPLSLREWGLAAGVASTLLWVDELRKLALRAFDDARRARRPRLPGRRATA